MLDEFVRNIEPVAWFRLRANRAGLEERHALVQDLVRRGLLGRAGIAKKVWEDGVRQNEILYGPTAEGREYWAKNVRGRRRLPDARAVPKYSQAQMAVATGPRDVFDLARVPWVHKLERDLD